MFLAVVCASTASARPLPCCDAAPLPFTWSLAPVNVNVDDFRDNRRPPVLKLSLEASSLAFRVSKRLKLEAALGFDVPPKIVSRATCVEAADLRGQEPYQLRALFFESLKEAYRLSLLVLSPTPGVTEPVGLSAITESAETSLACEIEPTCEGIGVGTAEEDGESDAGGGLPSDGAPRGRFRGLIWVNGDNGQG